MIVNVIIVFCIFLLIIFSIYFIENICSILETFPLFYYKINIKIPKLLILLGYILIGPLLRIITDLSVLVNQSINPFKIKYEEFKNMYKELSN